MAVERQKKAPGKPQAPLFDPELLERLRTAVDFESIQRSLSGSNRLYVAIAKAGDDVLTKGDPKYIPGLKADMLYETTNRTILGENVKVIIVGMFAVYARVLPAEDEAGIDQTKGFWHPKDALQVPLQGYFDRPLNDGTVLRPIHWIYAVLPDFPDLGPVIFSFRGKGNSLYKDIEKTVKLSSSMCAELSFDVSVVYIKNETYNKRHAYFNFELNPQKNFSYLEGEIVKERGGLTADEIAPILEQYTSLYESYNNGTMIQNVQFSDIERMLPGGSSSGTVKRLGGKAQAVIEDDSESVTF